MACLCFNPTHAVIHNRRCPSPFPLSQVDQDIVISKALLSTIYCLFFFIVTSPVTKLGLITNEGSKVSRGKIHFTHLSLSQRAEKLFMVHFYCLSVWPFCFPFRLYWLFCTFVCLLSLFLNLTISFRLGDPAMIEFFSYPCLQLKVSSRGSHTFLGNCPPTPPLSQH